MKLSASSWLNSRAFNLSFNWIYWIFVFLVFSYNFIRSSYGFDWTDTTYHFQEALNVANGQRPHKDFHSVVPGLSFIVEGFILRVFGEKYLYHAILGFFVQCMFITGLAVNTIIWLRKLNKNDALKLSTLFYIPLLGEQLAFNYTSFGLVLCIWIFAFLGLLLNEDHRLRIVINVLLISILLATVTAVKQSYGYTLTLGLLIFAISFIFTKGKNQRITIVILVIVGFSVFITGLASYSYVIIGDFSLVPFSETGGLELKGISLNDPIGLFSTTLGVSDRRQSILFLLIFLISQIIIAKSLQSRRLHLATLLGIVLIGLFDSLTPDYEGYLNFAIHYFSVSMLVFYIVWVLKNKKRITPVSFARFYGFALIGFIPIFAGQLSWPGIGYVFNGYSLWYSAALYFIVRSEVVDENEIIGIKSLLILGFALIFFVGIFGDIKEYRVHEYTSSHVVMKKPIQFAGLEIHPETKTMIDEIVTVSSQCGGNDLFQIPWAPVLYSLTGRNNITMYDLPYHDTISVTDADKIIRRLKSNPPSMLITEPQYFDYKGPFPATGMKMVLDFVEKELIHLYSLRASVTGKFKSFNVFCIN